jgi:FMN phosphatase YigB (HAD superfamily)
MIMPEIERAGRPETVHPSLFTARGIKLVTVDIENVLTDYGSAEVTPEGLALVQGLQAADLQVALATNHKKYNHETNFDTGSYGLNPFVEEVRSQLPGNIPGFYPFMEGSGIRGKTKPDMFRYALEWFGVTNPRQAAHIDDQFKSYAGLVAARFGLFVWTEPIGEHQHRGVRMLRSLEAVVRSAVASAQFASDVRRGR